MTKFHPPRELRDGKLDDSCGGANAQSNGATPPTKAAEDKAPKVKPTSASNISKADYWP